MVLRPPQKYSNQLYTADEFEQLPEFGKRYDLLDGKLVIRPVPGTEHSYIIDRIRDSMKFFDPERKFGYSLQEASVRLSKDSSPTPDIAYWKAHRGVKITKKAGPLPDLAVEVHSPSDLQSPSALQIAMIKVKKLVEAGVSIVWVVYPDRRQVEIYHASRGYEAGPVQTLSADDFLSGEDVIPGFTMPVADLFDYEQ